MGCMLVKSEGEKKTQPNQNKKLPIKLLNSLFLYKYTHVSRFC